MKSIIYKNPVISAILLNFFTMFLSIIIIKKGLISYFIIMIMIFNGILNGKILNNGTDMNNNKKIFIIISVVIMICVLVSYVFNRILMLRFHGSL